MCTVKGTLVNKGTFSLETYLDKIARLIEGVDPEHALIKEVAVGDRIVLRASVFDQVGNVLGNAFYAGIPPREFEPNEAERPGGGRRIVQEIEILGPCVVVIYEAPRLGAEPSWLYYVCRAD